ncbi:MAG: hypothetical protein JW838_04490 [Spirochaetes bacterium]|nr:hypothetical protein [Spirochaetota bacterium]
MRDYRDYYSFMKEKSEGKGYGFSVKAYDAIMELMAASADFSDFQKKFEEKNMALEMARARVKDEATVRINGYRALDETVRVKWHEGIVSAADGATSMAELTGMLQKATEEGGRAASADTAYLGFYAEWIILEAIRAYTEAVVPTDASAYPGPRKVDIEEIEKMGTPTPSTYPEIMAVYRKSYETRVEEYGKELDRKLREIAGAECRYDYTQLWEPRIRRAFPVSDATLERLINESRGIRGGA